MARACAFSVDGRVVTNVQRQYLGANNRPERRHADERVRDSGALRAAARLLQPSSGAIVEQIRGCSLAFLHSCTYCS